MTTTFSALQSTLSECLINQSVKLQVKSMGNQLSIVISRPKDKAGVDYQEIADILLAKLRSLDLPSISSVKLYGRMANTQQIEWQTVQSLVIENAQPLVSAPIAVYSSSPKGKFNLEEGKHKFQRYLEQFSHYSNVISAASLLGLLILLGFNTLAGQKTQAVEYEYKIDSIPDSTFTETMNQMGDQGWEMVFARRAQDSITDSFSYEVIFKRVKK